MLTPEQHIENLVHHIESVRRNCLLLGRRLMAQGRHEFGRLVVARGFGHDISKFFGIEWEYLHAGRDVPQELLDLAIKQHTLTNQHHPEYWGGFESMPEIAVAEMVCDWYARSQEFGTDLRSWVRDVAVPKYQIDTTRERFAWVQRFLDVLLEDHFVR
jgi:hypothetical protein